MNKCIVPLAMIASLDPCQVLASAARMPQVSPSASQCGSADGPGFIVSAQGMKDRSGRMILELYPANQADFLKGRDILQREGKLFRRVEAPVPAQGAARLCIQAPAPGSYALVFIHDRDGKDKFNIWRDGIGLPSQALLGSARPRVAEATVIAGNGRIPVSVRMQYIRGLAGFGPERPQSSVRPAPR